MGDTAVVGEPEDQILTDRTVPRRTLLIETELPEAAFAEMPSVVMASLASSCN